ncbi:MAG: hypothetical protein JXB14_04120 [Candidatus Altiarchaeota archaeon]|nr:hypothetical protein [Candidatus Altiarchaeota archaeon]
MSASPINNLLRKSSGCILVISALVVAQIPFGFGYWISEFNAPPVSGDYNLVIKANYKNLVGFHVLNLSVLDYTQSSPNLVIKPLPQEGEATSIKLNFEITLDGKLVKNLRASSVILVFEHEETSIYKQAGQLSGGEGRFSMTVGIPFKGGYKALVYVEAEEAGQVYSGTFLYEFSSNRISPELELQLKLDHRVLTPGEPFSMDMRLIMGLEEVAGANLFTAFLDGLEAMLSWNHNSRFYEASLNAPGKEGIYKVYVYAESQDFSRYFDIYVLDPGLNHSDKCSILRDDTCSSREDARKCFAEYRNGGTFLTEDIIIECMLNSGFGPTLEFFCESSRVGDLNADGLLNEIDAYIMAQYVLAAPEGFERQRYVSCADFNRDSIVDEEDFRCLVNVVGGKWFGGIGGGICLDFDTSSPLKGDLDRDKKITDVDVAMFQELVKMASWLDMPLQILNHTDFDQDSMLTPKDTKCLEAFLGLDLDNRNQLTIKEQVPAACLDIYNLDACKGIPGDMDGDTVIDEVDEILLMMASREAMPGSLIDMSCADVNEDLRLTYEDEICIKSYVSGDVEKYFVCINCMDELPQEVFSTIEICNDGWDNDCDGLVDRTSEDPEKDWCGCMEDTPCEMLFDLDRGAEIGASMGEAMPPKQGDPKANTKGALVCRDVSWDGDGYKWMRIVPCSDQVECETSACDHRTNLCAYDGEKYEWYPEASPPEETDDPNDDPKTCDDGHDNDCEGGDKPCKSFMTWLPIIIGAAVFFAVVIAPYTIGAFAMQGATITTTAPVTVTTAAGTTTFAAGSTITIPAGAFITTSAMPAVTASVALGPTLSTAGSAMGFASTGTSMATSP